MARAKSSGDTAANPRSSEGEVKMVSRHTEYVEPDVEAVQEAEPPKTASKNPHREGTAAWMAHENRKRQDKGLPATNNL